MVERRDLVADAAAAALRSAAAAPQVSAPHPLALSLDAMATRLEAHHRDLVPRGIAPLDLDPPTPVLEEGAAEDATDAGSEELVVDEDASPAWARIVIDTAAVWLHTAYTSPNTKKAHANALGIPRADQRLWRGEPTHRNVQPVLEATAFFPWCAAAGLNPLTDMTRDAVRTWLTVQEASGLQRTPARPASARSPRGTRRCVPGAPLRSRCRPRCRRPSAATSACSNPTPST
ncbi:hypothetical protein [Amycolatopsis sp. NPDC051903]|uniref:hypothetical protein n=1 Tax=Amycolatopsis sp. NPDC051903 TaxID=3363936 RepID=UPI0037A9A63B